MKKQLGNGYEIRSLENEEFGALWEKPAKEFFDDNSQVFRFREFLSEAEKGTQKALRERMGTPYRLNLGLYHNDRFVGWSWGYQESAETFYMCNSAIFPEHRRKGLYTELMKTMIEEVMAQGFQRIYSRHTATNNAVLIPKLKAGFAITGFEISDIFGNLVHLTYFPSAMRRKVLDYRVGQIKPDDELRRWLQLS